MIRITHVITNLSTGGAEMMLLKLAAAGSAEFRHRVISLNEPGSIGPRLQQLGVEVDALHFGGLRSISGYFRLSRILAQQRPDVIQGWMYHANAVATLVALQFRYTRKLIWSVRNSLDVSPPKFSTRIVIRLGAWLSSRPVSIIYNSWRAQHQHEALGYAESKSRYISNGIDLSSFCRSEKKRKEFRQQLGISEDKIVIGTVGRADPQKDHVTFVQAAASIADKNSQVVFLIAGRGVPTEFSHNDQFDGEKGLAETYL